MVESKGQSTGGDLDGRRRQSPRIESEFGLCRRRCRRGVLLFEESERQMLAAGHDDETRFLNARENLVSAAQGFVGQLLKDRSTSRQECLGDCKRGYRRFQVDRWSLDSLLYDRNSRRLGGPHRRNYSGWLGVALQ